MGIGCCADEDAGDGGIVYDGIEVVGKGAAGEEGRELCLPVGAFCTDIFQPDIVMTEDGIEAGHAMDAETDEGVVLLGVEEGALKVLDLSVVIKFL